MYADIYADMYSKLISCIRTLWVFVLPDPLEHLPGLPNAHIPALDDLSCVPPTSVRKGGVT